MGYYRWDNSRPVVGDDVFSSKRLASVGRSRYGGKIRRASQRLATLPVQAVAIIAQPIGASPVFPLMSWYVTTGRASAIVVMNAIRWGLFDFVDGIKGRYSWHLTNLHNRKSIRSGTGVPPPLTATQGRGATRERLIFDLVGPVGTVKHKKSKGPNPFESGPPPNVEAYRL